MRDDAREARKRYASHYGPMTAQELTRFKRAIATMNLEHVEIQLRTALNHFTITPLAPPRVVQEIVAFWQTLWKRRREPRRRVN